MSEEQTRKATIGDEIPYRRSTMDKRTGSLVFDRHLDETVQDAPEPSASKPANPLKQGQVG